MISLGPSFADWARSADSLLQQSLASPSPLTLAVVFAGGLLTSLGPCSLSLLPVTLAYLAGFEAGDRQLPWQRSLSFACGIVGSLVILGLASGLLGRIYGQIPGLVPILVAVLALVLPAVLAWFDKTIPPEIGSIGTIAVTALAGMLGYSLARLKS